MVGGGEYGFTRHEVGEVLRALRKLPTRAHVYCSTLKHIDHLATSLTLAFKSGFSQVINALQSRSQRILNVSLALHNIPHVLHLTGRIPLPGSIYAFNIEIPEQSSKNQSHFHVREMLPNASTRTK